MAILTTKRVERERFELKVQTVKTNLLIGVVIACTALLVQAQDRKTTQSQALSRLDRLSGDLKELKRSNRELLRTVAHLLGVRWGQDEFGWWAAVPKSVELQIPE